MLRNKAGQSTYEFALMVIVLIAALLSMQVYIKRSIEGRFRKANDQMNEGFYSPSETVSQSTTTSEITEESESTLVPGVMFIGDDINYTNYESHNFEETNATETVMPPAR